MERGSQPNGRKNSESRERNLLDDQEEPSTREVMQNSQGQAIQRRSERGALC